MRIDQAGIDFIKSAEGVKNFVYADSAGLPTIGVGHLLTQDELTNGKIHIDGKSHKYHDGLPDDVIDRLLLRDLHIAELSVRSNVRVNLTQNQYNALVSFAFNVGVGAFRKSTLLRLLNNSDYESVPYQMRRWVFSAGRQIQGLKNRREKEIELWNKK